MRYLWLIASVALCAGLVGASVEASATTTESAFVQEDDQGNKPRRIENREQSNSSQPSRAPSSQEEENPFRKKQRRGDSTSAGGVSSTAQNAPQQRDNREQTPADIGRVPLEGRRVPLEARPVPFEARPVLTPPTPEELNRPTPIQGSNLPALVRQAELLNPHRWRDRYVLVPIDPTYAYGGFYVEYQLGRFRFSYRYYYVHPEPYRVVYAPYWYYDPCPPFIVVYRVAYMPPQSTVFVEVPLQIESPYYLERRQPDEQQRLLSDLRAAWLLRDPSFVERYIRPNSYIAIYLDGQYAYSLPAQDFIELTRDAIRAVKTEQIRFTRISKRGETQLVVRGEHHYIDEATGIRRLVYIHYTFERVDGRWYLIEAGSSANRL
ncbi:MAG: hypothetical protein NZ550_04345 [Fimbriimonadales bacterium]|nr:hypothetical protein [Fimbriimonadales bacterium]MDW8051304.1 hypothetical protein [Armatimonadota bacterium]